jgi:AraC family transcriptional regulator
LGLSIPPDQLRIAAKDFEIDSDQIEIKNRFQVRDPQLENIAWALKAEMECGYPSGRLYFDSLAMAIAVRLVRCHSSLSFERRMERGRMSVRKLKDVLSYIDENLAQNISLGDSQQLPV